MGQCLEGLLPLSPAGQGERSTAGASGGVGGRRSPQFLSCPDGRMLPFGTDAQFLLRVIQFVSVGGSEHLLMPSASD